MYSGHKVLVVETQFIIALGIQDLLETRLSAQVILAADPDEAHDRAAEWSSAALAIIELERNRPDLVELARQISQSGIPVLGLSADAVLAAGVPELPGTPVLIKPVPDEDLAAAIKAFRHQYPLPDVT
jgi:CheY-like chemotaxis protein